jgi:hypothetical protein
MSEIGIHELEMQHGALLPERETLAVVNVFDDIVASNTATAVQAVTVLSRNTATATQVIAIS